MDADSIGGETMHPLMPMKPWEHMGVDQYTYRDLPWNEKRKVLIKMGIIKGWWLINCPTFRGWAVDLKLWWNRPAGGYLLNAHFKDNAEKETIKWKYGKRVS